MSTKLKFLFSCCLLSVYAITAQVTFMVNQLPANHDTTKPIYISGDFEGWSGGSEDYKLAKMDTGYAITLDLKPGAIAYKFTQGSWDLVEYDAQGAQRENRLYTVTEEPDTVYVKIASWTKSESIAQSTASKNVSVLSESFKIPQLDRERRVWIYLPPDYEVSNQSYPVLYMHDGQNLFDVLTSYSGEWQVDETLDKLYRNKNLKLIVVGIDNGGDKRLSEYSPWDEPEYGKGEGMAYTDFIVNTLKPYVDSHYRTLKKADNTGIMGSSLGGLVSHYAALKYPDVFGKVGVFSPSFWFADQSFEFARTHSQHPNQKMYFLAGAQEDQEGKMVQDMLKMTDVMQANGFKTDNIFTKVDPKGQHDENFWKREFEHAVLWLFQSAIQPTRKFKNAQFQDGDFLSVKVTDGEYHISFYNSEIIETVFIPDGEAFHKQSHAVILKPAHTKARFSESPDAVLFKSDGLSVKIEKNPFKISYWYKGQEVLSEKNGYRKNNAFETLQFNLTPDEVLYGGGARALGMNRRGYRLQLYNKAHYGYETHSELMNYTMPLMVSSKQYMVHFDNAPIGYLDLDSHHDNTLTYETISGQKVYQVIVGHSWGRLVDNYTQLTGRQPMPPRWALGNFSSRFGYHSQKEVQTTIDQFKKDSIPVDAVILDLYWFGKGMKGTMGNLQWLRDSFPNPKKMIKDLKQQGVKTILITEPFVLTTSNRWNEVVEQDVMAKDTIGNPATYDFYFGNTGLIDVFKPKAQTWFWDVYKGLVNQGVAGFWGDLGEPEVHPEWVRHATGTADQVHNIYGHEWARLIDQGYAKDFPNQRPFILMRAGYSGSQHYGMIPWSGDVNRTWGGLQSQPEIALQMGLQGLAYMHSDLGGFAGANLDDELYERWLQYGVFQPIFRPHAQEEVPSEPVYRSEEAKQSAKESIALRYKLLPYNYNLVYQNHIKGTPLMRPLFFEDSTSAMYTNAKTYFWGSDFLITPVLESGAQEIDVTFPKESVWFDFYSGEKVKGGQIKTVSVEEDNIPTYVRAGAFIPMVDVVQSTDDYTFKNFNLHYFYDATVQESEREFYNDDGVTKEAFEKGQYEMLAFEFDQEKQYFEITFEAKIGSTYQAETKHINLIVHNIEQAPKHIRINGKKIKNYQYGNGNLSIPVTWQTSEQMELKIKI